MPQAAGRPAGCGRIRHIVGIAATAGLPHARAMGSTSPVRLVRSAAPLRVVIVAFPDVQSLDVTGPLEVFSMAVDPELLAILVCPKTKGPLELIDLKEETRRSLVEKYREKFRGEEPVVTQGLYSKEADLVYPIVSDIPVMLIDEALPGSEARS